MTRGIPSMQKGRPGHSVLPYFRACRGRCIRGAQFRQRDRFTHDMKVLNVVH